MDNRGIDADVSNVRDHHCYNSYGVPMSEVVRSYASKCTNPDGSVYYSHFFQSRMQMMMCGEPNPIVVDMWYVDPSYVIKYNLDNEDQWMWGWYDFQDGHFTTFLTQQTEPVFNMQFAYGPMAEVERGKGKIVRVFVSEVEDAVDL